MLIVMWTMDTQLKMFQNERLLVTDRETVLVILWERVIADFCPCSKNQPEAKLKSDWINYFGVGSLKAT